MSEITIGEFKSLVGAAEKILVKVTSPAGDAVYFEISDDVAIKNADKICAEHLNFEMDDERFLWIGERQGLRIAS